MGLINLGLKGMFKGIFDEKKEALKPTEEVMPYKLFPVQKEWAQWAFDKKAKVKLFLGARWYGKKESVLFWGIIEELRKNPELTFIIRTRTHSRGEDIISTLGYIMQHIGFKGKFYKTKIQLNENKSKIQPTVVWKSVTATRGGGHADFLIDSHLVDTVDHGSQARKNLLLKAFKEAQYMTDYYICIGQSIEKNDVIHYIKELPEIKNNPDALLEVWHGTIPELDKNKEDFLRRGLDLTDWGLNYEGKYY